MLRALYTANGTPNLLTLARECNITYSSATETLNELHKRGFVEKDKDGRAWEIRLSATGREFLERPFVSNITEILRNGE